MRHFNFWSNFLMCLILCLAVYGWLSGELPSIRKLSATVAVSMVYAVWVEFKK